MIDNPETVQAMVDADESAWDDRTPLISCYDAAREADRLVAAERERCIAIVEATDCARRASETKARILRALRSELSPPTTPESEGEIVGWTIIYNGSMAGMWSTRDAAFGALGLYHKDSVIAKVTAVSPSPSPQPEETTDG